MDVRNTKTVHQEEYDYYNDRRKHYEFEDYQTQSDLMRRDNRQWNSGETSKRYRRYRRQYMIAEIEWNKEYDTAEDWE